MCVIFALWADIRSKPIYKMFSFEFTSVSAQKYSVILSVLLKDFPHKIMLIHSLHAESIYVLSQFDNLNDICSEMMGQIFILEYETLKLFSEQIWIDNFIFVVVVF